MPLIKAIGKRYSVRAYDSRPVENEKLMTVLEAARCAPSARNTQEWRFLVVRGADARRKLAQAAFGQAFVAEAPVVIACCAIQSDYIMRCGHPAHLIDLPIAIEHMALQAVEEGLGTCWVGSFDEEQVKTILGIPAPVRVIQLLTLGYPRDTQRERNRLAIGEIVSFDTWNFPERTP